MAKSKTKTAAPLAASATGSDDVGTRGLTTGTSGAAPRPPSSGTLVEQIAAEPERAFGVTTAAAPRADVARASEDGAPTMMRPTR